MADHRPTPLNVILIGFMGCGKSAIGQRLAGLLGFDFVDTDARIVEQTGRTIPEIFAAEGEAGFRLREAAVVREFLDAKLERAVISTGGGIVTQPVNKGPLQSLGWIVWLTTTDEILWQRVRRNRERPMLHTENPRITFDDLLNLRRPLYRDFADATVDTCGLTVEEAAYGLSESVRVHFNP